MASNHHDRLVSNRCIISLLAEEIEKNSDIRFHQLLQNLNVVKPNTDQFYEESFDTLNNLMNTLKEIEKYNQPKKESKRERKENL